MNQHATPGSGLTLFMDEDGGKLLAVSEAGSAREPIDKDQLGQMLVSQGFADLFIFVDALEKLVQQYSSGSDFTLILGELRDGDFSLGIDADLMAARLTITPSYGGKPILAEQIYATLQEKGVCFGIQDETIQACVDKGYARNKLIAEGIQPTQGDDAQFISLLPDMKNSRLYSEDLDTVDYRNFSNITTVKQGDPLMRRLPATAGRDGTNILGLPVPAPMGNDTGFSPKISGAEIHRDDPDLLIAAISGQPFLLQNGVMIEPVITIRNVDLSTGNLDIEGSLTISGDVKPGMQVKATADIVIHGMVEAAHIVAGGDIEVKGAVIGQGEPRIGAEEINPAAAVIQASGSVTALFVENSVISASTDIVIREFVMKSELNAGNSILVGEQGSNKGRIISSVCRAAANIAAITIGSRSGTGTVLEVGADPSVQDKFTLAKHTIHGKEKELEETLKALEYFRDNPNRTTAEVIHGKEKSLYRLQTEIQELTGQLRRLKKRFTLLESAWIKAERQIFCGVRISIGEKTLLLENDMEGVTFTLGENGITF